MSILVLVFAWATAAVMGFFTLQIMRAPKTSLGKIMHDIPELPEALVVRYVGLTALAVFVALSGSIAAITGMFAAYAIIGLGDALVYRRAGKPHLVHLFGGGSAVLGTIIGLVTLF